MPCGYTTINLRNMSHNYVKIYFCECILKTRRG